MQPFEIDLIDNRLTEQKGLLVHIARMTEISAGKRRAKPEVEPGAAFVLDVAARVAAKAGNVEMADRLRQKAATAPAQTTVAGWAAELAIPGLPVFLLSATTYSAFAEILRRSPQLATLDKGTIRVPIAGAATPATIVGEGQPIPLFKGSLTAPSMSPSKFASLTSFTEELARSSNIEQVARLLLQQSIGLGVDGVAFSSTPPGILNGLVALTASNSSDAITALTADIATLVGGLTNPSANIVFAMNVQQWTTAGALIPSLIGRIFPSSAIPPKQVIAIDPNGVAAALDGEPSIMLSESATVHESDAPAQLAIVGSPNSVSAPMRSSFQTDTIIAKITFHAAWTARPGSVSFMNSVKW